jgi:predicted nucleotidyltransferase
MEEDKRREYQKLLKESLERVVKELSSRVEKISVFGSYPKKAPDLFTDLDILIIMKTDKPFLERMREIYSLLALPVDADILCYTPEEFERISKRGFFRRLLREEVVLYEKGGEGGGEEVAGTGDRGSEMG